MMYAIRRSIFLIRFVAGSYEVARFGFGHFASPIIFREESIHRMVALPRPYRFLIRKPEATSTKPH